LNPAVQGFQGLDFKGSDPLKSLEISLGISRFESSTPC
jgi:hypothetical protein